MRISMVLAGLVAFSAVACGGSSDDGDGKSGGGSPTVTTNIPGDTQGNELTDTQTKELCDAAAKAAESAFSGPELKAASCGMSAYFQATLLQAADKCQEFYDACMKTPEEPTPNDPDVDSCTKPSSSCKATVAEMQACWSDAFAQVKTSLANLPGCEDVGKEVTEPTTNDELPASCKVVQEKCPEALDTAQTPELPGTGAGDPAGG